MTTFYLIRHALKCTDGNILTGRAPGVHLSEQGRWQAEKLARRLADVPIGQIFSSPLERARETAYPVAREKGLEVQVSEAVGEIDFGAWTNKSVEELEPDARWQQFNAFRSGIRAPGGETMLEVQARFVGELLRLREAYPEDTLAIFSHSDPLKAVIAYFAGAPIEAYRRFEIESAAINIITISEYRARIRTLNDTWYLDGST